MKDVIIEERTKEKEKLLKSIMETTALAEMAQVLSLIDLAKKYIWAISNIDIDTAKKLRLTGIKKYWRRVRQVKIELYWLNDWIPALATFVRHLHRVYNNKKVTKNMNVR